MSSERHNPLYLLLLVAGIVFVITAGAYAIIPILEQKAIEQGELPPPSAFRDALRRDGWLWLLCEVAVLIVIASASMIVDRLRSLQKPQDRALITPTSKSPEQSTDAPSNPSS